jgi:hypothetical protein
MVARSQVTLSPFHERAQAHRHAKDRANTVGPALAAEALEAEDAIIREMCEKFLQHACRVNSASTE